MSFVDNTIDFLWQNFLSPEFGVSEGSSLIFGDTQIALQHKSGTGGRNPPCQNQLDSSSHFDTTPACNRLTGRTDARQQQILRQRQCWLSKE